jgi:hypothetical protein
MPRLCGDVRIGWHLERMRDRIGLSGLRDCFRLRRFEDQADRHGGHLRFFPPGIAVAKQSHG